MPQEGKFVISSLVLKNTKERLLVLLIPIDKSTQLSFQRYIACTLIPIQSITILF